MCKFILTGLQISCKISLQNLCNLLKNYQLKVGQNKNLVRYRKSSHSGSAPENCDILTILAALDQYFKLCKNLLG